MANPFAVAARTRFRGAGSTAAAYTPKAGQAVSIRVIWDQGSDESTGPHDRRVADVNTFEVQRSDVAQPGRGDTIVVADPITGDRLTFEINGAPIGDVEGISWRCPAQPV